MGINCHLKTPTSILSKKIEIEKLFCSLKHKQQNEEIKIDDEERLLCDLKQIELKSFIDHNKNLLRREDYKALKEFKQNENIIIRKADKSNTIVIINRDDYSNKVNNILSDSSKLSKIRKKPTEDIKKENQ